MFIIYENVPACMAIFFYHNLAFSYCVPLVSSSFMILLTSYFCRDYIEKQIDTNFIMIGLLTFLMVTKLKKY